MRIVICAYNEARLLPVCLGRLPQDAKVTLIDGAYAGYPHDVPWSTDGTCEIAERWGADVVQVTRPWVDQIEKRSFSLTLDPCVFVLDADEMWMGGNLEDIDADVGWVTVHSPLYPKPYLEPRIFRVQNGWHYEGRHHWVYDADSRLVASHRAKGEHFVHAETDIEILNARHWRRPDRLKEKSAYARVRNRKEGEFHAEHTIGSGVAQIRDLPRPKR